MGEVVAFPRVGGLHHRYSRELQGAAWGGSGLMTMDRTLINHGYCQSLYLRDPDGPVVKLAVDNPEAVAAAPSIQSPARAELDRWLAGDLTDNNDFRRSLET